jgi:hypothetical protein
MSCKRRWVAGGATVSAPPRFHRDFTSHSASKQAEQMVTRLSSAHGLRLKVSNRKRERAEEAQETKGGGLGFSCSCAGKITSRFHFALRTQASGANGSTTSSAHVYQSKTSNVRRKRAEQALRRRVVGEVSATAPKTFQQSFPASFRTQKDCFASRL